MINYLQFRAPSRGISVLSDIPKCDVLNYTVTEPGIYYYADMYEGFNLSAAHMLEFLKTCVENNTTSYAGMRCPLPIMCHTLGLKDRDALCVRDINPITNIYGTTAVWGNAVAGTTTLTTIPELVIADNMLNTTKIIGKKLAGYENPHVMRVEVQCYLERLMAERQIRNGVTSVDGNIISIHAQCGIRGYVISLQVNRINGMVHAPQLVFDLNHFYDYA